MPSQESEICLQARQVAAVIRRFVSGRAGEYEWDDVMGIPFENDALERARLTCEEILDAGGEDSWTNSSLLHIAEQIERELCGS